MKYFRNLLKIKFFISAIFLLTTLNVLSQNEKQQLRLAQVFEKNHEYESALKIYKNLENKIETKNAAENGIQECLKGLRRYDELVSYLEIMVTKDKQNYKNRNSLAEAYLLNSDKIKAVNLWNSLLQDKKNDINVYRLVAGSMIKNRLPDNAVEVYELALKNLNNQQILHLDLANLYKSMLNMEKAARHFLDYYSNYPNQKSIFQQQILNLSRSEQHVAGIAEVLNDFIKKQPEKIFIKEILGGLYIKSNQFNKAYEIYGSLEDIKNDGSYLFEFGKEAQKNKHYDFAIRSFNRILENNKLPIYTSAYFQLATTYYTIASGNRDSAESATKAIEMFENLVSKKSIQYYSDLSCMLLGDIYLIFYFDLDKAIFYYNCINEDYPKSKIADESLIKLGDSYLMKGDLSQSEKTYSKNKSKNSFSLTSFKLGELDYYRGNFAQALQKYNSILEKNGIADSLANNALERQLFINSFISDSLDLKFYASGEFLVFQQKYSEAAEHLNKLLEKKNSISSHAGKLMAEVLIKLEKFTEANSVLTELISQFPDDYFIDEFLFKNAVIEEKLGNYQKSFELYQVIMDNYNTSFYYEKARENARILSEKIKKEQVSG